MKGKEGGESFPISPEVENFLEGIRGSSKEGKILADAFSQFIDPTTLELEEGQLLRGRVVNSGVSLRIGREDSNLKLLVRKESVVVPLATFSVTPGGGAIWFSVYGLSLESPDDVIAIRCAYEITRELGTSGEVSGSDDGEMLK